jgi:hypothetical protein
MQVYILVGNYTQIKKRYVPFVFLVTGQSADVFDKGPIHFQCTVRDIVMQHRQIEEQEKKEIWPATPKSKYCGSGGYDEAD